eukprot:6593626-Prymnesium_polylepis.2
MNVDRMADQVARRALSDAILAARVAEASVAPQLLLRKKELTEVQGDSCRADPGPYRTGWPSFFLSASVAHVPPLT